MRHSDNELLTRIGPATPMGRLFRAFWLPALKSGELTPGGWPVRLRLLGESFIAFRTESGAVGVLDHACAHRCASLSFGRNEAEGIRCVYHGWKFAVDGRCVEMPSDPKGATLAARVRVRALHVRETHGLVWVHFASGEPPAFPEFDVLQLPPARVEATITLRECNWLQALEGDIDTAHVGFLHLGGIDPGQFAPGSIDHYRHLHLAPEYEVLETPWGTMYDAWRPAGPDARYHRVGQYLLPCFTMTPPFPLEQDGAHVRAWVPADDTHTWLVELLGAEVPLTRDRDGRPLPGSLLGWNYLPNTGDWLGRWRVRENAANDYGRSRELGNFTGISGIPLQDHAITESMGPIVDRRHEHLGTSDAMIVATRQRLLRALRAPGAGKEAPPEARDPARTRAVRSGYLLRAATLDWLAEFNALRARWRPGTEPFTRPDGQS